MSEEKKDSLSEAELRRKQSEEIIIRLLLTDFETGEELVIGSDVQHTEDGKGIVFICVKDENSKKGMRHTIYSEEVFQAEPKDDDNFLVDSNGEKIKKD